MFLDGYCSTYQSRASSSITSRSWTGSDPASRNRTFPLLRSYRLERAIDILAVADFDDVYDELVVFNSIHDSILPLADSIAVLTGQLLTSHRAGVVPELLDPLYDALTILFPGNGLDLLHRRGFCQNPISSHYASDP